MGKTKAATLDWYLRNKVDGVPITMAWKYYDAISIAKEICHYNYKKYKRFGNKYNNSYYLCPEKLFIIMYVVYGCYLAEFDRSLFVCDFCKHSENDDSLYISSYDVLDYYETKYDVRKFYEKDPSYDKYSISKSDKKFIHKIVEIFNNKGLVYSRAFIELYKLKDPNGIYEDDFVRNAFIEFINKYTIRIKVKD